MADPLPSRPPGPWTPTVVAEQDRVVSRVDGSGPIRARRPAGMQAVPNFTGGAGVSARSRRNCPAGFGVCKGSVNSASA